MVKKKFLCIRDLFMNTGEKCFTEGKIYSTNISKKSIKDPSYIYFPKDDLRTAHSISEDWLESFCFID